MKTFICGVKRNFQAVIIGPVSTAFLKTDFCLQNLKEYCQLLFGCQLNIIGIFFGLGVTESTIDISVFNLFLSIEAPHLLLKISLWWLKCKKKKKKKFIRHYCSSILQISSLKVKKAHTSIDTVSGENQIMQLFLSYRS